VCPLDGKKCEEEKQRYAYFSADGNTSHFDCYGALMRWLFWNEENGGSHG
jgi:hypothetical protein